GLNDGTAGTFRVGDGVRLATLAVPDDRPKANWLGVGVGAVAYSADGSLALVGVWGRTVGVWSERGDHPVAILTSPVGSHCVSQWAGPTVKSLAISPDNRWLFAGNEDATATIWDMRDQRVVFAAVDHAETIIALYDDGDSLAWATTAGTVWRSHGGAAPTKL